MMNPNVMARYDQWRQTRIPRYAGGTNQVTAAGLARSGASPLPYQNPDGMVRWDPVQGKYITVPPPGMNTTPPPPWMGSMPRSINSQYWNDWTSAPPPGYSADMWNQRFTQVDQNATPMHQLPAYEQSLSSQDPATWERVFQLYDQSQLAAAQAKWDADMAQYGGMLPGGGIMGPRPTAPSPASMQGPSNPPPPPRMGEADLKPIVDRIKAAVAAPGATYASLAAIADDLMARGGVYESLPRALRGLLDRARNPWGSPNDPIGPKFLTDLQAEVGKYETTPPPPPPPPPDGGGGGNGNNEYQSALTSLRMAIEYYRKTKAMGVPLNFENVQAQIDRLKRADTANPQKWRAIEGALTNWKNGGPSGEADFMNLIGEFAPLPPPDGGTPTDISAFGPGNPPPLATFLDHMNKASSGGTVNAADISRAKMWFPQDSGLLEAVKRAAVGLPFNYSATPPPPVATTQQPTPPPPPLPAPTGSGGMNTTAINTQGGATQPPPAPININVGAPPTTPPPATTPTPQNPQGIVYGGNVWDKALKAAMSGKTAGANTGTQLFSLQGSPDQAVPTLPAFQQMNYTKWNQIRNATPDAFNFLKGAYNAGNRDLDSEYQQMKYNAPIGDARYTSGIRTTR